MQQQSSLLEVRALQVAYGGIQALKGIELDIAPGELVALIGSNGAGKTTALKALAGLLHPSAGRMHYAGQSLLACAAHQRVRDGMVLVPEGRGVFARLTVEEYLQMGAYTRRDTAQISTDLEHKYALFPRLAERRTQLAGTLSGGEQQMVAIGRGLMAGPRLLMLDEPSLGLAPILVEEMFRVVEEIHRQGVTVLLVEQNTEHALAIAHRGFVLESGRVVLSGSGADLLASPKVREAYLGL